MKTAFLFTVDVESRNHGDPGQDILGVLSGHEENVGIERLMDLLEADAASGTFFLNVYEAAKHGEESIAHAARLIHSRGHDLELHTHPRPMYPFYGISEASREEQTAILRKGTSLLEGWTGKKVVAHRAGAFSANTDTLRAAGAVGLLADCSLSPGSRVSVPLVHELGASNAVRRVHGIWEIPVTCFDQVRVGPWRSRRILDIEGCSLAEIKRVTRHAIRCGLPTVSILMHSFSLSRYGKPNRRVIKRLRALLAWLRAQDDLEICTVEQVCRRLDAESLPKPTLRIPVTGFWLTWRRAVRAWDESRKNLLVAAAGAACLAALTFVLVCVAYLFVMH
ncbi:MAG: polysaccharide deacetylase family protein [Rhodanobacteraceae bacterium]